MFLKFFCVFSLEFIGWPFKYCEVVRGHISALCANWCVKRTKESHFGRRWGDAKYEFMIIAFDSLFTRRNIKFFIACIFVDKEINHITTRHPLIQYFEEKQAYWLQVKSPWYDDVPWSDIIKVSETPSIVIWLLI